MADYYLGVNGCRQSFHDASAALLAGDRLLGVLEEERFNRVKHTHGIPVLSAQRLLDDHAVSIDEIRAVGYYLNPYRLFAHYYLTPVIDFAPASFQSFQGGQFFADVLNIDRELRANLGLRADVPVYLFDHHRVHAASAFYPSPFEEAAVLVIDGSGEQGTATVFVGEGTEIRPVRTLMQYPESIGFFYESVAEHLGLGWLGGAGKLMGLAPYGKPTFYSRIAKWFERLPDGRLRADLSKFGYYVNGPFLSAAGAAELGPRRDATAPLLQVHADVAASAQAVLEDLVLHAATMTRKLTGKKDLCYAGGVALNIDANTRIAQEAGFERIHIQPAAYDGGCSLGAAYLALYKSWPQARRSPAIRRVDFGTSYSSDEVGRRLKDMGRVFDQMPRSELLPRIAEDLVDGHVVGWFRGRMELGPRALGFRSILADPRRPEMRDFVNAEVKFRELFRPLAPVVKADRAEQYFQVVALSPYMLYKYPARPGVQDSVPAVVHVDGSARAQTVTWEENEDLYDLLSAFEARTGLPMLLNTSLNLRGEPLVESPEQAVYDFDHSAMSVLVIEDCIMRKTGPPPVLSYPGRPTPANGVIDAGDAGMPSFDYERGEVRPVDVSRRGLARFIRSRVAEEGQERFFRRWHRPLVLRMVRAYFRFRARWLTYVNTR
jgi:carbamoyltransferase